MMLAFLEIVVHLMNKSMASIEVENHCPWILYHFTGTWK